MRSLIAIIAAALIATLFACNNDECYDNRNALPLAGFYAFTSEKESAVTIDSISVYGLGAPGDSLLLDSVRSVSQVYLPFRIDRDETTYVIHYLQSALSPVFNHDTITFYYDTEARFVSAACGASYLYTIRDIASTHYQIDSVVCPQGYIDNANSQNLRIYFRTPKEGEGL